MTRATLSRGQKLPKAVFSAVLDRLEQAFGEQHDPAACTPDGAHQADGAHPTGAQTSITLAIGTSEHRDEYCAPNKTALCSNCVPNSTHQLLCTPNSAHHYIAYFLFFFAKVTRRVLVGGIIVPIMCPAKTKPPPCSKRSGHASTHC